jgi:hypothetical protein
MSSGCTAPRSFRGTGRFGLANRATALITFATAAGSEADCDSPARARPSSSRCGARVRHRTRPRTLRRSRQQEDSMAEFETGPCRGIHSGRPGSRRHRRPRLELSTVACSASSCAARAIRNAFIDLWSTQYIALQKGRTQAPDDGRHASVVVDDKEVVRQVAGGCGRQHAARPVFSNFLDPWAIGSRAYGLRQHPVHQGPHVLRGMGCRHHCPKMTRPAIKELTREGDGAGLRAGREHACQAAALTPGPPPPELFG